MDLPKNHPPFPHLGYSFNNMASDLTIHSQGN